MNAHHKVSHSLNVKLSQDDLELDLLIIQPENVFFGNGRRTHGCLLALLNNLKTCRVNRLHYSGESFVSISKGDLRRLVRRVLLRLSAGVKPFILLHHAALSLVSLALLQNE